MLLVRQFRHLARADSWELPGGGGQPGEGPEAAAQRELREEGERRVVPFGEAVAMALDDRMTESVSKVALLAAALKLGHQP